MALQLLRSQTLVSPAWVASALACGENIEILDCSRHLPDITRNPREEYAEKHIPGARFFDLDVCADKTSGLPLMMPDTKTFEDYVGGLGISNSSLVLLYDNHPHFGVFTAVRVWWTFRYFGHNNVVILEGGLPKYISEGYQVTSEVAQVEEGSFTGKPDSLVLKKYEDIVDNLESKEFQHVDARPSGHFNGTAPAAKGMTYGSIPHSVNLPFLHLLNNDERKMKTTAELLDVFKSANIDFHNPVVGSCIAGLSSSVLALAVYLCGQPDIAVYDGSWVEWAQRAPEHLKENYKA